MSDVGAAFSLTRQTAITRRAPVALVFDTAGGSIRVRSSGTTLYVRALRASYGVAFGANRDSSVYDGRGLGYGVSNVTLTVRRGTFVDTLTMSRLGRAAW